MRRTRICEAYELSRIHDYLAMKFNRETGKLASEELKSL
jgi:hypothetical protein